MSKNHHTLGAPSTNTQELEIAFSFAASDCFACIFHIFWPSAPCRSSSFSSTSACWPAICSANVGLAHQYRYAVPGECTKLNLLMPAV